MPLILNKIKGLNSLEIFHVGPAHKEPLPTLFYFALSGPDSLSLDPFNQPVEMLKSNELRIFSFTLPGHGEGLKNTDAMKVWADSIKDGKDPLEQFTEHALKNIDFLIQEGYIDPSKVAVGGLSRGAYAACLLAAKEPRITHILGFAPLIDFSEMDEMLGLPKISLLSLKDPLSAKKIRFYIGNNDTRVGVKACFQFVEELTQKALENKIRTPAIEMMIKPSIGYKGHGTAPETFKEGIEWLKKEWQIKEIPMSVTYSLVIPLKNEEDNIQPLVEEVEEVMNALNASHNATWELIAIDDGSTDGTLAKLTELKATKPFLRILKFTKNFGQSSAFDAGFRNAQGKWIITLDGDRQNDPHDIPRLMEAALAGSPQADLVCGIRKKRKDTFVKRITSKSANFVRKRLIKDGIQDTGCSLKLYRRACFDKIKMFQGMHRFLPALFKIEGFEIKEIPVNHRERVKGQTKYNFFNRSFNTVADMFAVRWMQKRRLHYQIEEEL